MKQKRARHNSTKTTKEKTGRNPLLVDIITVLDAKKAEELQVIDVSKQSSITDYLVIATGTSEPHLRALRVELEKILDERRARIIGMDSGTGSGWLVIDAFDVMVHLFTKDARSRYRLDLLWKDGIEVPLLEASPRASPLLKS
jgi:ribosome-associated protein